MGEATSQLRLLTSEQALDCGMGKGAQCCAYLLAGAKGFECGQKSSLAGTLYLRAKSGQMSAQRTPVGDFPDCQREGRA